jgi:hypothetical protein
MIYDYIIFQINTKFETSKKQFRINCKQNK